MAIERVALLYDQKRYDLAEREARSALASDPGDAGVHAFLSLTLVRRRRARDATAEAEAAIAAAPDLPIAHYAHAFALAARGQLSRARQAAAEASRLNPSDPDYHALVALVELTDNNWFDAFEATSRGLAIVSDHADLLQVRAMAAAHLERFLEADESSASALRMFADEPTALAARGYQLMHAGKFAHANETFRQALRLDPMNRMAARGLTETARARNPVYRLILRYFLWLHRLAYGRYLLLALAGPVIIGTSRLLFSDYPFFGWLAVPLAAISVIFIVTNWLAPPLWGLGVASNPFSRQSLKEEPQLQGLIIGALLTICLIGLVVGSLGADAGFVLAVAALGAAVATVGAFQMPTRWARWVMRFAAVAIAVGGTVATLALTQP